MKRIFYYLIYTAVIILDYFSSFKEYLYSTIKDIRSRKIISGFCITHNNEIRTYDDEDPSCGESKTNLPILFPTILKAKRHAFEQRLHNCNLFEQVTKEDCQIYRFLEYNLKNKKILVHRVKVS